MRTVWRFPRVAVVAIFICLIGPLAYGQNSRTWVSGVGDDTYPCTRTAPCRTFAAAFSQTAAGGEIDVLDPGGIDSDTGFGPVTITNSISIETGGIIGGITASGGSAITVAAGPTDVVVIRGITLDGLGTAQAGISFQSGGSLYVEHCFINAFQTGISIVPSSGTSSIFISDTIVRNSASDGIQFNPSGSASVTGTLKKVRTENNGTAGLEADGSGTNQAQLSFAKSTSASNAVGLLANGPNADIYYPESTIFGNGTNLLQQSGGHIAPSQPTSICVAINAIEGMAISPATMTGIGGAGGPYTFTATGLPPGLSISSSGAISGTPTMSGIFNYTVTVTDNNGSSGTVNCSVTVYMPVTSSCVAITAVQGVAISPVTMTGSGGAGGSYTFTATGLPPGLSISSSGTISGTPAASGPYNYTITVTDNAGNSGTVDCSVTVYPPLTLACASANAEIGLAYSSAMVASGGVPSYTYSINGGSLPLGLSLNPSTGAITGTPTTGGTYNYTAQVADSNGDIVTNSNCSITVAPALTLACASSSAEVGVPYSSALVTTGGLPSYTYSISNGSLPPGLSLNTTTGTITGTPTTSGTYNYTAKVVDSIGATATNTSCSITVAPALALACASSTAEVGVPYSSALVASGGVPSYTYSISSGSLPPGLSLNTSTGAITGTPTTSGTYNYTAKIVDSGGGSVTNSSCSITVAPALALACASSGAEVGVPYSSALVASGGVPSYTYSISGGSLPPGLSLNTSTGAISGTPTTSGTYNYTAKVVDSGGGSVTSNCSISMTQAPAITSANSASFTIGLAGSFTVTTTGIPVPSITETGSLPNGLTFVDNGDGTGTLKGTAKGLTGGNFAITLTAKNGVGSPATQAFTLILDQGPAFTSASSAAFATSVANSFTVTTTGYPTPSIHESGALPVGVTFVDNGNGTGKLAGTPTVGGTFNLVFSATNAVTTTTQNFTLTVAGLTVSPANLNFSTAYLNGSQTLPVTVTNEGPSPVTVSGVSITPGAGSSGAFKAANQCTLALGMGQSCTIEVTFLAKTVGTLTGTLNITDNAPGSPQHVNLSGNVIDPVAQFSPTKLAFASEAVGSSTTLPVKLKNSGKTPLFVSDIAFTGANAGDFSQVNNCPAQVSAGMSCTISVTFTPAKKGARSATLVVTDNVAAGSSTVAITGTGH